MIREKEEGEKRCLECDRQHEKKAIELEKEEIYECHAGLTDFVVPIKIEDTIVGIIIGGQLLLNEPDRNKMEKFIKIAEELGIDENKVLKAVSEIPIKRQEEIDNTIKIIKGVVPLICNLILKMIQEEEKSKTLEDIAKIVAQSVAVGRIDPMNEWMN